MLIDGRAIAQDILSGLTVRVRQIQEDKGFTPHMGVLRVGDDPAITSYINQKKRMAKEIGAILSLYEFPVDVTEKDLVDAIHFLIAKGDLQGLIVQLPLPGHIDGETLVNMVPLEMDIDGFRKQSPFEVPVALAVMAILETMCALSQKKEGAFVNEEDQAQQFHNNEIQRQVFNPFFLQWLKQKSIIVIGKGKTAGEPIIQYLQKHGFNPIVIDTRTGNTSQLLQGADIIISAAGKQGIITKQQIKQDVMLIGVGLGRGDNGKVRGDYDEEEIRLHASFYTPTPGGVGPVNVAKLMENLVTAAERH